MIKKWIARWFGGAHDTDSANTAATPAAAAPPHPVQGAVNAGVHASEVDTVFYRWLTTAHDHDASSSAEKLILDELSRLAQSPGAAADLVPRVPAVIPQLLRSLRDDSMSGADLSRQLMQDVVLVAEVIREANSPYYHPTAPVKTIEGAIMLLGQNGLRMLLARVAFRPIISMQSGQFAKLVAPQVWRQSEKCALAANMLAPGLQANPFEAYLAGLMQNVGLIVAFRVIDQIYPGEVLPQSDAFCQRLFAESLTLSSKIAALWDFPVTVSSAIAQSGQPGAPALARTLALADRLAKLRMLVDAGQFDADDPFVLQGLDRAASACFDKLRIEEN